MGCKLGDRIRGRMMKGEVIRMRGVVGVGGHHMYLAKEGEREMEMKGRRGNEVLEARMQNEWRKSFFTEAI